MIQRKISPITERDYFLHFYLFTFLPFYFFTLYYIPMQDVAPRAVRMADAMDAIICTTHLKLELLRPCWLHFAVRPKENRRIIRFLRV